MQLRRVCPGACLRLLAQLGAAALLHACTVVGPDYVRPSAPVPAQFRHQGVLWKAAQPGDVIRRANWWELYEDPQLNALAERVERANQNVHQAEARVREAQAIIRQAQARAYPLLGGGGSANRSCTVNRPGGSSTNFDFALDAAWEPDLWGRVRRSVEASQAQAQAAAADAESVRLAALAALVQNYLVVRVIDVQVRVLNETVEGYERFLQLTRNRYNAGVVSKADVVQAQAQLRSTQAQRLDLGVERAQFEHAIAVLVGEPPAAVAIAPATMVAVLPAIPPGIPSVLLERRPDIAAAERNVAAANARIGVAESAFYPALDLTGSWGLRGSTLANLLSAPAVFWALGSVAAQTLFDAGERRALSDEAQAAYDAQVAAYRQTVLTAFQEVEDQLAALRILEEEANIQAEAVAASRESVELARNRYKAGTANFLEVITLQAIALNNERNAVAILGRRLAASVQLVKALGGGWDARSLELLGSVDAAAQARKSN
jgi:NodT family efflux transporter outer membrane factor (OMF) lipoprotein